MRITSTNDSFTMTAAEFSAILHLTGLNHAQAAEELGVQERNIRRWAQGKNYVPQGIADIMLDWLETYKKLAASPPVPAVTDDGDVVVPTSNGNWWDAHPEFRPMASVTYRGLVAAHMVDWSADPHPGAGRTGMVYPE